MLYSVAVLPRPVLTVISCAALVLATAQCANVPAADILFTGGKVYTFNWPDPDIDGHPSSQAPRDSNGWKPDADTIAVRGDRVIFVGVRLDAEVYVNKDTRIVDLGGATVVPGLIESHAHIANYGASLERVNLVGVPTEADAVDRVVERARKTPKGEWIVGWGWDEGAWTTNLPTMKLLSERVPDHPVVLHGLHTFAVWGNRLAFERAGITAKTPAPVGGEIKKDASGKPTGVLLNNAGALLDKAVPAPTHEQLVNRVAKALGTLLLNGYTAVDEAGADGALMAALEELERTNRLLVPVYAMLSARDTALVDDRVKRGPSPAGQRLTVRSVKAYYDGAMGSRGAFFLEPYADRAGWTGVGGANYGFDAERVASMMRRGFQVSIHAIGDRANREALDLIQAVFNESIGARETRPRIEHAQVLTLADIKRFADLGVIASMQPAHAVEDMAWAEARIGPERARLAYAWRAIRRAGARLAFNSDLPATDSNIFYGLHSAVTRTDKKGQPPGGWHPEQAMTIEEALRGWTSWAAYASFTDQDAGKITPGRFANLTVMDIDPLQVGEKNPARLMDGRIVMTVVRGQMVEKK